MIPLSDKTLRIRQTVDRSSFVRLCNMENDTANSSRQPQRFAVNIKAYHSTMALDGSCSVSSHSLKSFISVR